MCKHKLSDMVQVSIFINKFALIGSDMFSLFKVTFEIQTNRIVKFNFCGSFSLWIIIII